MAGSNWLVADGRQPVGRHRLPPAACHLLTANNQPVVQPGEKALDAEKNAQNDKDAEHDARPAQECLTHA